MADSKDNQLVEKSIPLYVGHHIQSVPRSPSQLYYKAERILYIEHTRVSLGNPVACTGHKAMRGWGVTKSGLDRLGLSPDCSFLTLPSLANCSHRTLHL